jgi:hypothetical protein
MLVRDLSARFSGSTETDTRREATVPLVPDRAGRMGSVLGVRLAARPLYFSPLRRNLFRLVTSRTAVCLGLSEAQALRRAAASPRHKQQEGRCGFLDFKVCGDG